MGRAKIIEDLGGGKYSIQRLWSPHGRTIVENRIAAFREKAAEMQVRYDGWEPANQDELFNKKVLGLQIESLKSKANYLENNMPTDEIIEAWCADFSEGITGHPADVPNTENPEQSIVKGTVGTIDVPGEYTDHVNIRPTVSGQAPGETAWHDLSRDGELWPSISLGAWTSILNQMVYPGWQKYAPLHRYGIIVDGTINNDLHTCTVQIDATLSNQQGLNVNQSETIENVPIEYMSCNSHAFENGDHVIIEFTGQDWDDPKVIGFVEEPATCSRFLWNMFGGDPYSITAYNYAAASDSWSIGHGEINYYDAGDPDYSGLYYFYVPGSYDWSTYSYSLPIGSVTIDAENGDLRFPVITRYQPMITYDNGNIFSFGGWFNTGDYFPMRNPVAYVVDTCEKYNVDNNTWLQRNKDQYTGRSYGAAWVLNNKHYIACGAQYDERVNTFFPHIDLDSNYVYGNGECPGTPGGPGAVQSVHSFEPPDQDVDPGIGPWSHWWNVETQRFEVLDGRSCFPDPQSGGKHSYPPPDGRPYWESRSSGEPWDLFPEDYVGLYWWVDGTATWGKQWYSNQVFGECLEFDDSTNTYAQKTQTTSTMMMGQFSIGNDGYICGGTYEEIPLIINSADTKGMTNSVRKYLADVNSWQTPNVLPEKLLNPSGFEINGKGYLFSGYSLYSAAGSTFQDFGHEQITLNLLNIHPESPVYRGGNVNQHPLAWLEDKTMAAEVVRLFCKNDLLEYNPVSNAWLEKQRASTPTGNCRYREYFNRVGTITDPFYYGYKKTTVEYERHDGTVGTFPSYRLAKFEKDENPYTDFYEVEEPGPYLTDWQLETNGAKYYGTWYKIIDTQHRNRKRQHIYKYPAYAHGGFGYVTSGAHVSTGDPIDHVFNRREPWDAPPEPGRSSVHIGVEQHMSAYDPLTDSWTVKETGIKEHLSGGMAST